MIEVAAFWPRLRPSAEAAGFHLDDYFLEAADAVA